jgi:hypothetical protein
MVKLNVALGLIFVSLVELATPVASQELSPLALTSDLCPEPNDVTTQSCSLATPDTAGTTVRGWFHSPIDADDYRVEVPEPGAYANISMTDLWHEAELHLYDARTGTLLEQSDRRGSTQGQLRAPEVILRWLEPGSYIVSVRASREDWSTTESHSYTLRVAFGAQPTESAGSGPAPASANGYHLILTVEPSEPGPFSLLTFTALMAPPFSDLFDFEWSIDGQPFGGNSNVVQLARPASGTHTVLVVAHGARRYPDPMRPELPPTLSTTGVIRVR